MSELQKNNEEPKHFVRRLRICVGGKREGKAWFRWNLFPDRVGHHNCSQRDGGYRQVYLRPRASSSAGGTAGEQVRSFNKALLNLAFRAAEW